MQTLSRKGAKVKKLTFSKVRVHSSIGASMSVARKKGSCEYGRRKIHNASESVKIRNLSERRAYF